MRMITEEVREVMFPHKIVNECRIISSVIGCASSSSVIFLMFRSVKASSRECVIFLQSVLALHVVHSYVDSRSIFMYICYLGAAASFCLSRCSLLLLTSRFCGVRRHEIHFKDPTYFSCVREKKCLGGGGRRGRSSGRERKEKERGPFDAQRNSY